MRPTGLPRGQSVLCLLFSLVFANGALARQVPEPDGVRQERVRVFLDCGPCDFDYLRREIEFIDYVRDRTDADVHVLVTTQPTGAGGTEYVFTFIGLGRFAGVDDEVKFTALETFTRDERGSRLGQRRTPDQLPQRQRVGLRQPHDGGVEGELGRQPELPREAPALGIG